VIRKRLCDLDTIIDQNGGPTLVGELKDDLSKYIMKYEATLEDIHTMLVSFFETCVHSHIVLELDALDIDSKINRLDDPASFTMLHKLKQSFNVRRGLGDGMDESLDLYMVEGLRYVHPFETTVTVMKLSVFIKAGRIDELREILLKEFATDCREHGRHIKLARGIGTVERRNLGVYLDVAAQADLKRHSTRFLNSYASEGCRAFSDEAICAKDFEEMVPRWKIFSLGFWRIIRSCTSRRTKWRRRL
jgi:hypothetical protein